MFAGLMISLSGIRAQSFLFGADLSYVNEMEDCGATFNGPNATDPFLILHDRGCNLVRLRLWHTPSWYDTLNQGNRYGDEADVRQSIARARVAGMRVLLDFHLSDTWADPAHQVAPVAWHGILDDLPALQDSLYDYIYGTLHRLAQDDLLPDIVQVGNETNKGILQSPEDNETWQLDWSRNTPLFNTAFDAIRDIESLHGQEIRTAIHIGGLSSLHWLVDQFWIHDVRDFDIIGLSWYYEYHNSTFAAVGQDIARLRSDYPGKDVMIFETAYPFTSVNLDGANNLLSRAYPGYSPFTPVRQRDWMITLTQEVINRGGIGVVYWEPAWVSTSCRTQWAQGSHWDNATFFDANHHLIQPGGADWMAHPYTGLSATNGLAAASGQTATWTGDGFSIALSFSFQPDLIRVHSIDGQVLWHDGSPYAHSDGTYLSTGQLVPGVYVIQLQQRGMAPIVIRAIVPR